MRDLESSPDDALSRISEREFVDGDESETHDDWFRFTTDGESVADTVLRGLTSVVAETTGESLQSMRPVYDAVDLDAIDGLFPDDGTQGRVTFAYDSYFVHVLSREEVVIQPRIAEN